MVASFAPCAEPLRLGRALLPGVQTRVAVARQMSVLSVAAARQHATAGGCQLASPTYGSGGTSYRPKVDAECVQSGP